MSASLFLLVSLSLLPAPSFGSSGGGGGSLCPRMEKHTFLDAFSSRCPSWIDPSPPLEVDGETLDAELSNAHRDSYFSVIFYASWCPFSRNIKPAFYSLSLLFPQIRHLAVEESSAMPMSFSRYGVQSFPTILIAKGAINVHFHGPKDLGSLVLFYKEITGLEPLNDCVAAEEVAHMKPSGLPAEGNVFSREVISSEPYLAFGIVFLLLKFLMAIFPKALSLLRAFLLSHHWPLPIVSILRERSRLLDIKRLWSNLKLRNRSRNFCKGAENMRVWASSSLASVSLGESSTSSPRAPGS